MTKHLRFLFVMLLAMIWSAGWAQTTIWSEDWSGVKQQQTPSAYNSAIYSQSNNDTQIYIDNSAYAGGQLPELLLKGNSTWTVTIKDLKGCSGTFKLEYKSNKSLIVTANSKAVNLSNSDNLYTGTFDVVVGTTQLVLTFEMRGSKNARIDDAVLTATSASDTKTATNVSFGTNSNKTFTFTEGKYSDDTFTTPTATEKDNIAGTIKYSSDNTAAISVDASTGALTFNGYGKATITATFTPNDTEKYVGSTDSYIVENNQKVDESVILFSADAKSFESITGSYKENVGKIDFIATNGKKYTFDVQRAMKNKGRLQLNSSNVTSPSFPDFTNGYKVTIEYETSKATITLSSGSKSVKGSSNDKTISLDVQDGSAFKINITSNVLYISKIEIVPNKVGITLDENSESNTIEAKNGVNVTLKRTMVANEWNTICLPFAVTMDKAKAAFGDNVKIVELDTEAAVDANVLSFKASTGIVAATPYLIKPSAVSETGTYTFDGVDIAEKNINDKYAYTFNLSVNNPISFKGIYNKVGINEDVQKSFTNNYAAFLGAGNKIYKADGSGNKTKGFRAYFAIPKSASASALRVVIDGTATSIKNIDSEVVESNAPVYNLQGQRVDGNNLTPGIYVKAGKKFVVK